MRQKLILWSVLVVLTAMFTHVAPAMTMSELQSAVDAASAGDTVYLTSDIEFAAPLTVAKKITIASVDGEEKFVLYPASDYTKGTFMSLDSEDADVMFSNLIFDGQRGTTNCNTRELFVLSAGKLTLGAGAVIRNRYCPSYPAVQVTSKGHFVMEEGSEIRGIVSDNYGVAVKTGAAGNSAADGKFTMNGGIITECAGHHKNVGAMTWDGVVYLYGGTFYAHGGTICGNTSDYSTAGVCLYYGPMYVSGNFTATNNVGGKANDVCLCRDAGDNNVIMIDGDYTGHMTVAGYLTSDLSEMPEEGARPRYIYTSQQSVSRLGCENIVSEVDPSFALDLSSAQIVGGWYPKWRRIAAKIVGKTNTFSYQDAYNKAISGDTIMLCQDIGYAKHTWMDKDLTFTSDEGGPYVIRKAGAGYAFAIATNATVTFRNVILDGNDLLGKYNRGIVEAHRDGTIVLDAGTVIRHCVCPKSASAVLVYSQPGARLVIKDGVMITECSSEESGYGSVISIGNGEVSPSDISTNPPKIEMQGGVITGCSCTGTSLPGAGYSGMVYIWSPLSTFEMSGGAITGNVGVCTGVVCYQGKVKFSGDAVVEGGEGAYRGVYACSANKIYFSGDFRGRVDVANGSSASLDDQATGKGFKVLPEDASATGAWCFRASRSSAELVGANENGSIVWAEPIGSVAGVKAAKTDDLQLLIPISFDMNVGSADYARLPVVLTGAATALGAEVALTFDKDMRKHMPAWSQSLFVAGAEESLSGNWMFALPEGAEKNWAVATTGEACSLTYTPSGSMMILR